LRCRRRPFIHRTQNVLAKMGQLSWQSKQDCSPEPWRVPSARGVSLQRSSGPASPARMRPKVRHRRKQDNR
jgi:hypothetical protein